MLHSFSSVILGFCGDNINHLRSDADAGVGAGAVAAAPSKLLLLFTSASEPVSELAVVVCLHWRIIVFSAQNFPNDQHRWLAISEYNLAQFNI